MINLSIDKLLNKVGSKYLLVNIAARRAKEMNEQNYYQLKANEYASSKDVGRALEEIAKDMVHIEYEEK